ncbi:MAG: CDP-3,6-dideoxy-D-glycero-L-glycero-4-hexulose-4-reductase [Chloroflexi bacterium]|nr:CDP-3,6-dideoxy-D-glycero-L-glycero-4-hexulose-4-reductase [Chloroflexota bacterium]
MSKIVSVHSFRGGTGKSNITANTSTTVAQRGFRVGVVDTDIQSPGIHVLFGLEDEQMDRTLNDFLWGKCPIEDAAYEMTASVKAQMKGGGDFTGQVYLIPSSIKTSEIAKVLREGYDVSLLNEGFKALCNRMNLDYLFIDTHPGLNEETLLSIAISNALILILRPDQQDFQGTAVTVEVARKLDVERLLLVVNKVLTGFDFEAVRKQVESTYDAEVAGVLPESDDMIRLASGGVFCMQNPDHQFSQTIRQIADKLMEG